MHALNGHDIDQLWQQGVATVLTHGRMTNPRGFCCWSVGPVMFRLDEPRRRILANPVRAAKHEFMAGELTWILSGSNKLEPVAYYNQQMKKFSDDGVTLYGAYGPRIMRQLPGVIKKLKADPDTRQAVISIWCSPSHPQTKDLPCTVSLQFKQGNEGLDLVVYMRSNDLWLGFPYDVFTFTCLQEIVANELLTPVGEYHHVVGDLHLYQEHLEKANQALKFGTPSLSMRSLGLPGVSNIVSELVKFDKKVRDHKHDSNNLRLHSDGFISWLQAKLLKRRLDGDKKRSDNSHRGRRRTAVSKTAD